MNPARTNQRTATSSIIAATCLVALAVFAAPACVSVNIGGKKISKAARVDLREPSAPFMKWQSKNADGAWVNKKTGNTISYLSTCNDPSDPSVESAMRELLSSLDDAKTVTSGIETYNGREALHTDASGLVDGVKTRVEVVVFKRNDCVYTLSYVAVMKAFEGDQPRFKEFLDGFRAP